MRWLGLMALLAAMLWAPAASAATPGALTQLAGTAGCVTETGNSGACSDGKQIQSEFDVVLTPDGKFAYSAAWSVDAIDAFSRDADTGALNQLPAGTDGCISE